MIANSFCAFFSFRAFVFVGFFLLHLEAVFTSARFCLTADVSHGTLDLVLSSVCTHFAAVSRCALTKFLYSSFGVRISVFSCCTLNLFLSANHILISNIHVVTKGRVIVFGGRCSCGVSS